MTVIGGWLGSGKTTLLNRLLTETTERVAVVVNDVGELNIDVDLIDRADDELVELTNGCVCCSIGGSLAITLRDLAKREPAPDRIVIEASGVAEPGQVARFGDRRVVPLESVIVTADATDIRRRVEDPVYGGLASAQLDQADRIVVTKLDLLTEAEGAAVQEWLDHGRTAPVDQAAAGLFEVNTATATIPPDVDPAVVAAVLGEAPPSILRAKGIVGDVVVHLAGERVSIDPVPGSPAGRGRVVVIGSDRGEVDAFVARLGVSVSSRP